MDIWQFSISFCSFFTYRNAHKTFNGHARLFAIHELCTTFIVFRFLFRQWWKAVTVLQVMEGFSRDFILKIPFKKYWPALLFFFLYINASILEKLFVIVTTIVLYYIIYPSITFHFADASGQHWPRAQCLMSGLIIWINKERKKKNYIYHKITSTWKLQQVAVGLSRHT